MRIIALYGDGQSGKTSVLLKVINRMISMGFNPINQDLIDNGPDCSTVLQSPDNCKIGVCTMGDYVNCPKKYLKKYLQEDCEVSICAWNRNKSQIEEFIRSIDSNAIIVHKTVANEINKENAINDDDCNVIIETLDNLLKSMN